MVLSVCLIASGKLSQAGLELADSAGIGSVGSVGFVAVSSSSSSSVFGITLNCDQFLVMVLGPLLTVT